MKHNKLKTSLEIMFLMIPINIKRNECYIKNTYLANFEIYSKPSFQKKYMYIFNNLYLL